MRHLLRAKQCDKCAVTSLGRYCKPPQLGITNVSEPRQQSMTTSSTQHLLRGP